MRGPEESDAPGWSSWTAVVAKTKHGVTSASGFVVRSDPQPATPLLRLTFHRSAGRDTRAQPPIRSEVVRPNPVQASPTRVQKSRGLSRKPQRSRSPSGNATTSE